MRSYSGFSTTLLIWGFVIGLAMWGAPTQSAFGDSVACGDVLTEDTRLDEDLLDCVGTALFIGADGVTLDLDGHVLTSGDGTGSGVDVTGGYDHVTIKNGAIDGFQEAILAEEASDLTIKDVAVLSVSGSGTVPGQLGVVGAIFIKGGEKVVINDSWISGIPTGVPGEWGPDAILLYSVEDVSIKDVDIDGGFAGVSFASCGEPWLNSECPPLDEQPPVTGTVKDCTISNTVVGVFLINARDVTIKENVITGDWNGVRIGLSDLVPVSDIRIRENEIFETTTGIFAFLRHDIDGPRPPILDLTIEENYIHDNSSSGMELVSVRDSRISENVVVDNRYGISFWSEPWFGNPDPDLRTPSIGNEISENTCTSYVNDLFHDATSTPNVWEENCFETGWGADIGEPECDDDDDD